MTPGASLAHRRVRAPGAGEGGGPRALLVHGWLTDGRVWRPMLEVEGEPWPAGAELVVPDLRGVGDTGGVGAPDLDGHVDDLLALADHLGWSSFAVLGHSMGGVIAQRLAVRAPERVCALGLLAPVPAGGVPLDEATRRVFLGLAGDRTALESFFADQLVHPERAAWLAEMAVVIPPPVAEGMFRAWSGASFAHRLGRIRAPTHVAAGRQDPYLPPDLVRAAVVERIPGARFSIFEGAGHYPHVDRPGDAAAWAAQVLHP